MNRACFTLIAIALGFTFVEGCGTPATSNKPWDKPIQEDNRPGYKSSDAPPLDRDSR
jgi:hypothetical protein